MERKHWKNDKGAARDLAKFRNLSGINGDDSAKGFARASSSASSTQASSASQQTTFFNPRTGEEIDPTSFDEEPGHSMITGLGRGRLFREGRQSVHSQIRRLQPIGMSNRMLEAYFARNATRTRTFADTRINLKRELGHYRDNADEDDDEDDDDEEAEVDTADVEDDDDEDDDNDNNENNDDDDDDDDDEDDDEEEEEEEEDDENEEEEEKGEREKAEKEKPDKEKDEEYIEPEPLKTYLRSRPPHPRNALLTALLSKMTTNDDEDGAGASQAHIEEAAGPSMHDIPDNRGLCDLESEVRPRAQVRYVRNSMNTSNHPVVPDHACYVYNSQFGRSMVHRSHTSPDRDENGYLMRSRKFPPM